MNYNESLFNCSLYKSEIYSNTCNLKLGYTKSYFGIGTLIGISFVGIILNILFLIFHFIKRKKKSRRKALMHKIFLIFPFTDLLTSIYWLISSINYNKLEKIKQNMQFCALNSVFYIFLITFQFILINILLLHFRKINKNPLEAINNPAKKLFIYLIICILTGFLVSALASYFKIIGISPMNTCFISVQGNIKEGIIILIPLILFIIAIYQLIHDIFFIRMFTSNKGIRLIFKKNSIYVLIFCLMHIPLFLVLLVSLFYGRNYFELTENIPLEYFIKISTIITCIIPFVMSLLRQIQGLARLECINECIKKRERESIRRTIIRYQRLSLIKNNSKNFSNNISLELDPFEWLEKIVMENLLRDILLGIAVSIKDSEKYDINNNGFDTPNNNFIEDNIEFLKEKDFEDYVIHNINFENFKQFNLEDQTVINSDYLNIQIIDYAPKCFHYLRKLENIDIKKMIESFLPKNNSQGIKQSLGKSGSFFISTDDNRYMIKTLKSDELELLKHAFLSQYINHIKSNPKSLLCRLYGMYNIILGQGDEIKIIVMRNVIGDFKDNTIVKFDLKGSTYKRKSNFEMENDNNVMKDLDFNEFEKTIMLGPYAINRLRKITKIDSTFLKDCELMDYSLFIVKLTLTKKEEEDVFGTTIGKRKEEDFKQIINEKNDNIENFDTNNDYKGPRDWRFQSFKGNGKIHDVEYYKQYLFPSLTQGTSYIIAIIDYFQIFNFFKYMESRIKNNFHKKNTISCVDPVTYSERFIKYINMLTNVKQYLSNEIHGIKEEEEKDSLTISDDEDDDDNDNIIKKYQSQKGLMRISDLSNKSDLLLTSSEAEDKLTKT